MEIEQTLVSKASRGLRHSALMALCNAVVSRFLLVALTFVSARYLSVHDFGVFAVLMSSASSVATLSAFGVGVVNNTVATRHYTNEPEFVSSVFTGVLAICLVLSLVFALAFFGPLTKMESGFSNLALLGLLFFMSALMTMSSASEGLAYGTGRIGTMLLISLAILLVAPITSILLMRSYGLGGAITALLMFRILQSGLLITALLASTRVQIVPIRAWRDRAHLKKMLVGVSLPLAAAGALAAPVTTVAMLILQKAAGTEQVASFALAYQLFLVLVFPLASLGQILLSQLATKGADRVAVLKRALVYLSCYGIFGWASMVGFIVIVPYITTSVTIPLSLLAAFGGAVMFYALSIGFNSYWPSIGQTRTVLFAQIGWAIPFIILTSALAWQYGALALGIGFLVGSVFQFAVHLTCYSREPLE